MRLIIIVICFLTDLSSFAQSFVPDSAVNKIALDDSISVLHILGKDSWNALTKTSETPKLIVYSQNQNEMLELIFHEGNNRIAFQSLG